MVKMIENKDERVWDVVEEVLRCYELNGKIFDTFCLLQPTSPLRTFEDIKNAYDFYEENKGDFF